MGEPWSCGVEKNAQIPVSVTRLRNTIGAIGTALDVRNLAHCEVISAAVAKTRHKKDWPGFRRSSMALRVRDSSKCSVVSCKAFKRLFLPGFGFAGLFDWRLVIRSLVSKVYEEVEESSDPSSESSATRGRVVATRQLA